MFYLNLYGEDHTKECRTFINDLIRDIHQKRPYDYLILEELGPHSYFTKKDKLYAIDHQLYSVGPMGLELSIELDIPAIGMDLWDEDIYKDDRFDENNYALDVVRSFNLRELNMVRVLKDYLRLGNVAAIVGDTHLRTTVSRQLGSASPLWEQFAYRSEVTVTRLLYPEIV